jgi:hypothetical protein
MKRGLIDEIKSSWKSGGRKYFRHNLSCNLRHGRYPYYSQHDHSLKGKLLFRLGVLIMDPLGLWFYRFHFKYHWQSACGDTDRQYLYHPMFWVRWMARQVPERADG